MSQSLTIQILGWNSVGELPATLAALHAVPSERVHVRYIDNGSVDDSVAQVRRLLPGAEIIELKDNRGFSGGHNVGLARTATPYILILNPDVEIVWAGIERLLQYLEQHRSVGAIQGKLLRGRGENPAVIDSAGIVLTAALNGRDRGTGEVDRGQYDAAAALSATTGAFSLYRLAALQQIKHGRDEFFDNDFFAYKEDVDLGWRLKRAGWQVRYEPVVVGYHSRALRREGGSGWGSQPLAIYRRLQDARTAHSFRNWLWLIAKNVGGRQLLLHSLAILLRLVVFLILALFAWPLARSWLTGIRSIPRMRRKGQLPAAVE